MADTGSRCRVIKNTCATPSVPKPGTVRDTSAGGRSVHVLIRSYQSARTHTWLQEMLHLFRLSLVSITFVKSGLLKKKKIIRIILVINVDETIQMKASRAAQ